MDPYRPPQSGQALVQKPSGAPTADPFHGLPWEIGSALSATIQRAKQHIGPLAAMIGAMFGVNVLFSLIGMVFQMLGAEYEFFLIFQLLTNILSTLANFLLGLWAVRLCFQMAREDTVDFLAAIPTFSQALSTIVVTLLVGTAGAFFFGALAAPAVLAAVMELGEGAVLVLALLAGAFGAIVWVYVSVRLFFAKYLILDQDVGPIQALTQSGGMTSGNVMALGLWIFVCFVLVIVIAIPTCGMGFLLWPLMILGNALIYDNIRRYKAMSI